MSAILNPNGTIPTQFLPDSLRGKRFRDEYMQDWTVQVEHDHIDIHDPYSGQVSRRVARSEPKISMEFRGKPVTIDEQKNGNKRIAIWMPGEQMRTAPLLHQVFTRHDFYELCDLAMKNLDPSMGYMKPEQAFMFAWCRENYKAILKQEDERSWPPFHAGGRNASWDDDSPVIKTEDFTGEDGRRYTRPVAMTPEERKRFIQEEALRKQREEARLARIEREQAEMEAIPMFGAF